MRIGAHVSTAGGLDKAIERATVIGAEAVQIFASPPQSWQYKELPQPQADAFKKVSKESGVSPAFLHGVYLVNLGSQVPENLRKSIDSLIKYQVFASRTGCLGTIFHVGSHRGVGFETVLPQVLGAFKEVLEDSPKGPWLIIENSAGMGSSIGAPFSEIGRIMKELGDGRLRVCLDTQHSFANGYDFSTNDGLDKAMDEFDREVGLDKLAAVHANDSKCPLNGGIDRHQNIGEGHIGLKGFEAIMGHSAFREVPFLLEVPGFDNKGPDKQNVDILRQIRGS